MKAANYRLATSGAAQNQEPACMDCRYATDNRCHAYCVKFSTRVNPLFVCDEWRAKGPNAAESNRVTVRPLDAPEEFAEG